MSPALHAIRRRLNAQAYDMLNEELARLAAENETLRSALAYAEDAADHWHQQCIDMHESQAIATGSGVGITQSGRLVLIPTQMGAMNG